MKPSALTLLAMLLCAGAPALAEEVCATVPLADWQPRRALQDKLAAEGWTIQAIRADDGCYKVRATNERGERLDGMFDPATLELVRRRGERGGRWGHGRPGSDGDHSDGE